MMFLRSILSNTLSFFITVCFSLFILFTPNTAFADKKNWDFSDYVDHLTHIKTSPALVIAIDDAINDLPHDGKLSTEIDLHLWKLVILSKINEGKAAAEVAAEIHNQYDRDMYRDEVHYGRTMYQIVESLAKTDEINFSYEIIQHMRESVYENPSVFLEFMIDRCLIEVYIETFDYKRALDVSLFVLNHPDYRSIKNIESYRTSNINEVAFLYNKLGDGKNALPYIEMAEASLKNLELSPPKTKKAEARNSSNRARAYLHLGKNKEAEALGRGVLKASQELDEKYMIAVAYRVLGSATYRQQRYEEAIEFLEAGLALVEEHNIFIMKQPLYKEYASTLEVLGRHEDALLWQKKLNVLEMDVYDSLTTTREKLNDVEFQAFKSHQEVVKLRQENTAQRENYANEKNIRNLLIILVVSLLAAAGFLIGWIKYMRTTQTKLRLSEQNAQLASKAKTEFLATMSHEIRTPMNGVMGMAQILQNTNLSTQQKHYVDIMTRSGENLLVIINDILDFSKLEANKLELSLEAHNLERTLTDVICLLENKAEAKLIKMKLNYDPNLPKNFLMDTHRLSQVFTNLLGNAIKFTNNGEINVAVIQKTDKEEGKNLIEIRVKDTGIGISKEKLKVIFDKFTQAESSTTRKYGGTGLGLAISRRIVEAMDGNLTVKSRLGKGSTFIVSIPLETAPSEKSNPETKAPSTNIKSANLKETPRAANEAPPSPSHNVKNHLPITKKGHSSARPMRQTETSDNCKGLQILIAEDDEINLTVIKSMLNHPKISLTIANNGKEAVSAHKQQVFDVILMDVSMPVMDGVDATKAIRENEILDGRQHTPIICLSAHVMDHETEEFIESGMDDCLPKPINKKQLLAVIGTWLKNSKANQQSSQRLAS